MGLVFLHRAEGLSSYQGTARDTSATATGPKIYYFDAWNQTKKNAATEATATATDHGASLNPEGNPNQEEATSTKEVDAKADEVDETQGPAGGTPEVPKDTTNTA